MKQEVKRYLGLGVMLLGLWLIIHYWGSAMGLLEAALAAGSSLLLGCVIAYLINIPMALFERLIPARGGRLKALRRPLCLLLALACAVLLVVLLVRMILPSLIECVMLLAEQLPPAITRLTNDVINLLEESGIMPDVVSRLESIDVEQTLQQALDLLLKGMNGVVGLLISTTTSAVSGIITLALALIFSMYLLLGKERIGRQITRLLHVVFKPAHLAVYDHVREVLDDSFHHYIVGQCTEAVILGSLCILGMMLFRFPYAVMIGTLVGFTALIPIAGAYIGAAVGAFMIFTISPMQAIWFLIFLVILQQLEGNLIFPRVVGSSLGLPGIWVLAAVTVFGGLFGILGMVVGVPLTAAAYRLLREFTEKKERQASATESSAGVLAPEPAVAAISADAPKADPLKADTPSANAVSGKPAQRPAQKSASAPSGKPRKRR